MWCSVQTTCECQKCSKKGLLSSAEKMVSKLQSHTKKLFGFRKKKSDCSAAPSCGCETKCEPNCGCEPEPNCGCEIEPTCGCETTPSCDSCCSANAGAINRYAPAQSVPTVTPESTMPTVPAPIPDSQVDPFMDDAVNRIRKVPAKRINYQVPRKQPYGNRYDPQASRGVRLHLKDSNIGSPVSAETQKEDSDVVTASASLLRRVMSSKAKRLPQKDEPANYFNPLRQ